jgi:hypothetical protein
MMKKYLDTIVLALVLILIPVSPAKANGRVIIISDSNHGSKENADFKAQIKKVLNQQKEKSPFLYFEENRFIDSPAQNLYSVETLAGDSELDFISISILSALTQRVGIGLVQTYHKDDGFNYLSQSLATLYTHPLTHKIVSKREFASFTEAYLRLIQSGLGLNVISKHYWNVPLKNMFESTKHSKICTEGIGNCWLRLDHEIKSHESLNQDDFLAFVTHDFVENVRRIYGDAETITCLSAIIDYSNLELWNQFSGQSVTNELDEMERKIFTKTDNKMYFKWIYTDESDSDHYFNDIRSLFQAHKIHKVLKGSEYKLPAIVTIGRAHVDDIKRELESLGYNVGVIPIHELTHSGALDRYLKEVFNMDMCTFCKAPLAFGKLLACAKCRQVRYCSKECQKNDWKKHKQFCKDPTLSGL